MPVGASPWSVYPYDEWGMPMDVTLNIELAFNDVPRAADLLFSCLTDSLPADGPTGFWDTFFPDGGRLSPIGSPAVETIDGTKWERNAYAPWTVEHPELQRYDGFRLAHYTSSIPCNGASIIVAVKPTRTPYATSWTSVVDIFYNRLVLGVRKDTGLVNVACNGVWSNSTAAIADGKRIVLSLVAQPDGTYKVWANGTKIMDVSTTSDLTSLDPVFMIPDQDFTHYIDVGRNDPDSWSSFNGNIGDMYVYKAALTDAERGLLEAKLIAKFGITTSMYTITASAGMGGSISPSGSVSVDSDSNKTFTISASVGYAISGVLVDGVPVGPVSSYTFTGISADHTISATFSELAAVAVSGRVVDQGAGQGIPGAVVYFSTTPNASVNPSYTVTADGSGNFSVTVPSSTWYLCASDPAHITSADQTVAVLGDPVTGVLITLADSGRVIPRISDLLFSVITESLPASGSVNYWPVYHPLGMSLESLGAPAVETLDGVKWERNAYSASDGFRLATYSSPIPINGASIVAVVRPVRNTIGTSWTSCVDLMYDRLVLGIKNDTGLVCVRRNGSPVVLSVAAIPDGQTTVLSLVAQPDGTYKVWANGTQILDVSSTSAMTSLTPNVAGGFANAVNIGRNNPDGWSAFNGGMGDVFVYKVALSDADRQTLEAGLTAKFGLQAEVVSDIAALKAKPDGTLVRLTGSETVIYAPTNGGVRTTSFFYIGEAQGLGGLKVVDKSSDSLALGNQVTNLLGHVRKPAGSEIYLELIADPTGSGDTPVPPIGMNNSAALTDLMALTNSIKVWGKVVSVNGTTSFVISDGYGPGLTVNVNGIALPMDFDTTKTAVVSGVLSTDRVVQAQHIQAF